MIKVQKYFVHYIVPGSFFAEEITKEITHLDPMQIKWLENTYAFSFSTREDVIDEGTTYTGKSKAVGPLYYHPDSKIVSKEQIESKNDPADNILLSNMRCNGWNKLIYTRWGNYPQPYEEGKTIILKGNKQ